MISKNKIRQVKSLHLKKGREEQQQFFAEGSKLVMELLKSRFPVLEIFASADWIQSQSGMLREQNITCTEVTMEEMEKITALSSPSPVLGLFSIPKEERGLPDASNGLVLALDGIRDPGNLGTILRIADWFGILQVICSDDTVELFNPKVVQATMGSIARVAVFYAGLHAWLQGLPADTAIYGTFLEGNDIYRDDLSSTGVIIMGNESRGISPDAASFVNHRIFIPSFSPGDHAESLNASIATAIVCSEFRRRRVH